jgi:hypothetical protein
MSAKPPTAKAVKQIITKFEISYNEIVAAMKALAESEGIIPLIAVCARVDAELLFNRLHEVHDVMASREKGR